QAAIRVEEDRQVALRQDGQKLPEPLGGPLIKCALRSDPLGAATAAGVWLAPGNNKNQWLAFYLCEQTLELFGIAGRSNPDHRNPAKHRRRTPYKFSNHNTASC